MISSCLVTSTYLTESKIPRKWFLVDAKGAALGRLATRVATILMGKHKPIYTPFYDAGDFVVVINASHVKLSGNKTKDKFYKSYSGYPGGYRETKYEDMLKTKPEEVIMRAVRHMLPKRALGRHMLKKLKVYRDDKHPHKAQKPEVLDPAFIRKGRVWLTISGQQEGVKQQ
jgi:large subunit ribosomal protein L13